MLKVHDSTIKKRMNRFGRVKAGEDTVTEKDMTAQLRKTCVTMSFRQMRPKWRFLTVMHSVVFIEKLHRAAGDDCGLFCSHRAWAPCSL